jgi:hypothetical protein
MAGTPSVWVLDDGELDEVRGILQGLGVEYAYLRGEAIPSGFEPPSQGLLIATARRALGTTAEGHPPVAADDAVRGRQLTRIVVVGEESESLRSMLRSGGFDYLVRQPVHRGALRLLILRALYHGPEQRRIARLPVGYEVSYRIALRRRRASLLDISGRGCQLLMPTELPTGSALRVRVPAAIAGGRAFSLAGRAVRCAPSDADWPATEFAVGVEFENLTGRERACLRRVLNERASGPVSEQSVARSRASLAERSAELTLAVLDSLRRGLARTRRALFSGGTRRGRAQAALAGSQAATAERAADAGERRGGRRHRFVDEVFALKAEADRVLIGRDISLGGMRVDPRQGIAVGDCFELALYGPAAEEPLIVNAVVGRDDGEHGLALRFENVDPATAARLERFVATLPPIEPLRTPESHNLGAVVSEIRWSE